MKKERGFGTLNVLILVAVLLILLSGVPDLLRQTLNPSSPDQYFEQLQKSNRFIQTFLWRSKREDNYSSKRLTNKPYEDYIDIFPSQVKIIAATADPRKTSDTITVRYSGTEQGNVFNCQGNALKPGQSATSRFFINDKNELACVDTFSDNVGSLMNRDILMDDVDAMQIRFGEDTDNDGVANRYVSAKSSALDFKRVTEVKISILLRHGRKEKSILDPKFYSLQDVELGPFNDNFERRVYTTTIPIGEKEKSSEGM